MLAMSDTNINLFFPIFASTGVQVAFLVPTPNGYEKSIMDATQPVRELLYSKGVHNYENQKQGPEYKAFIETFIVRESSLFRTYSSVYRPITKSGDPRIWIKGLKKFCHPKNLLALVIIDKSIYVFNLSEAVIAESILTGGYAYNILQKASQNEISIVNELLTKLHSIHNLGFIPSITPGDPGVGDTLEHALGISRNNSRLPDYNGIELKTTRLTRNGSRRVTTRSTLFSKVPDKGKSYKEIVDTYGKIQTPRNSNIARLQLYETLRCSRPNAYGLLLAVDYKTNNLIILHQKNNIKSLVSSWHLDTLKNTLLTKHKETFWIKAQSETRNNQEYFRYDKVIHTKNPNASLLAPLIESDKITIDLAAHYEPNGHYRDHGVLFKILPEDLPLIMGNPIEYIL